MVDEFMLPGVKGNLVMDDEAMFERVDNLFEALGLHPECWSETRVEPKRGRFTLLVCRTPLWHTGHCRREEAHHLCRLREVLPEGHLNLGAPVERLQLGTLVRVGLHCHLAGLQSCRFAPPGCCGSCPTSTKRRKAFC